MNAELNSQATGFSRKSRALIADAEAAGLKVTHGERSVRIVKNASNGVTLYAGGRSILLGADLTACKSMTTQDVRDFLGIKAVRA